MSKHREKHLIPEMEKMFFNATLLFLSIPYFRNRLRKAALYRELPTDVPTSALFKSVLK